MVRRALIGVMVILGLSREVQPMPAVGPSVSP
jgi:hypothetical protein